MEFKFVRKRRSSSVAIFAISSSLRSREEKKRIKLIRCLFTIFYKKVISFFSLLDVKSILAERKIIKRKEKNIE
jgi:hypothetical protein